MKKQNQIVKTSPKKLKKLECARVDFSDYDFIRLFLALVRKNGKFSIDREFLRYQLYQFYVMEEYKDLFQDIAVKEQIEENFLDLEASFQTAVLYGLITPHDIHPSNSRRLILITPEESQQIINSYDLKKVNQMEQIVQDYITSAQNKSKTLTRKP